MFAKIFALLALASLACAGYSGGYSNNYGVGAVNTQTSWPNGYGAGSSNHGLNGQGNYNDWKGTRGIGGYGNYGAATSYANSNLQSYGGYGTGKYENNNGNKGYYNNDGYAYPRYSFSYGVNDQQTGDQKYQWEQRNGDRVSGSYGLKESDGTTREVRYHADDRNGFNTVVTRSGVAHHPY